MSHQAPSDFQKIADLEISQNKIRDILFFNSAHAVSQSNPFGPGRKSAGFGSKLGADSWFPLEAAITDINELLVATGVFDKLDVQSLASIVVGPAGTLVLKIIQHISDGKIFSLTPGTGRTVEITPGGNIEVPSTITLTDKDMVFMQYFKDTDTVKIVTGGGGGSSTLPSGTIENEHLEWNDVSKTWNAVQAMTHGATGPFAASGFHRFANDQIIAASRNLTDDGDLQIKLHGAGIFDITESANNPTGLQIRAQNAVNPDATFSILQFSDAGGAGGLVLIDAINSVTVDIDVDGIDMFFLDSSVPVINVQQPIDMSGKSIVDFVFLRGTKGSSAQQIISDDATLTIHSGWVHTVAAGEVFAYQIGTNEEYTFTATQFQLRNLNSIVFLDASNNQDARIEYLDPLLRFVTIGDMEFEVESVTPSFNFFGPNSTAGLLASTFSYFAKNSVAAFHEYARQQVKMDAIGATAETGSIRWSLTESGTEDVGYLQLNGLFQEVQVFKDLNMGSTSTKIDLGARYMEFDVMTAPSHTTATKRFLFQDTADNHLKIRTDTGLIDLETGGGGGLPHDDDVTHFQNVTTSTKTLRITCASMFAGAGDSLLGSVTLSANRTWSLPNLSGTIALISGGLQSFSADIEISGLFSPDVDLGASLGLAAKRFSKIFSAKWELGTSGTPIPNIELISNNIHIEASSGNDILIEENGTLFVRFDGGDNRAKFTRDMTLSSTRRLRAEVDTTEIGIMVDGYTGTLGTEGTLTGPYFEDTVYPNNAATEVDFNGNDGSIGVQKDTDAGGSADARLVFRAGGVWYFLTGFKL